ncbi:MAG: hypothetical protein V3575_02675 [Candidatus Absconditabacteria bacterium]
MVNKTIIFLFAGLLYISGSSWGYFEYKYYCKKQDSKIWVSQSAGDNYVKCFDLIKQIDNQRKLGIENIQKAQQHIKDGQDVDFYKNLQLEIKRSIDYGDLTKDTIIKSMSFFENELFVKFKKVLDYHITQRAGNIDKSLITYKAFLSTKLQEGDKSGFLEYRNKIELKTTEKIIIQNMLQSTNFQELMPLVQYWYKNYYK